MNPITLIHLVSQQTMQNVLPALALQPERIIQVRSQGEAFARAARDTKAALEEAGLMAEVFDWPLQKEFPDLEDTRRAMKYWLPLYPLAVVNLTGGTKLMSAGALLGAREFSGASMLYCDTGRRKFVSLADGFPLPDMLDFDAAAAGLTLRIVMAAHGKSPAEWRFDTAPEPWLAFGKKAFELQWNERVAFEKSSFSRQVRAYYRSEKGRIPKSAGQLKSLLEADLMGAFAGDLPHPVLDFLDAAVEAGVLRKGEDGAVRLAPPPAGRNMASHVETSANLLDGSWLELTVLDLVRQSPSVADPHWSVEPQRRASNPDAESFGETDIVCLRLPQGSLQVISCKTSVAKPLEHLESLRERATHLGGRFAKATLAILLASEPQAVELRRWGRLLGVEVLIGPEILRLAEQDAR
mgnify:CR=1 FL=1